MYQSTKNLSEDTEESRSLQAIIDEQGNHTKYPE